KPIPGDNGIPEKHNCPRLAGGPYRMKKTKLLQRCAFLFLAFALHVPLEWPQASTGTVSGTVRDQTGAVIPGADVSLTNTATNVASKTSTNQAGFYIFPGVVPGPYRLVAESVGMQRFDGTLTVQVLQSAVVDAILNVGQTATEVKVADVTPLLTVDTPTLSHVLERA